MFVCTQYSTEQRIMMCSPKQTIVARSTNHSNKYNVTILKGYSVVTISYNIITVQQ